MSECSKQPGRNSGGSISVRRECWETRPWVQEAHSGIGEMPGSPGEVNSGLWLHRHKLETHNNKSAPLFFHSNTGYVVTWPETKVSTCSWWPCDYSAQCQ